MNFSFELQWAALTGNVTPDAMMGISTIFGAFFGGIAIVRTIVFLAIIALMIVSRWRVFKKAGLPGRGSLIPFYNRYLMFKVGGRSGWNVLRILIPPVFGILMIINYFKIAKRFWKHRTYGLGIRFIRIIFIPILAFDDSQRNPKQPTKTVVKSKITPTKKTPIKKAPAKKIIKKAPAKKVIKKVKTLAKKK